MRLRTVVLLLSAAVSRAQVPLDAGQYGSWLRYLDARAGEATFACQAMPIRPLLNFSFRYQAGYVVRVPMAEFAGKGHRWNVIAEVLPRGGAPVYFGHQFELPEVPSTHLTAEFSGGYLLGVGQYRARWVMVDERQRVCRHEWEIEVKPTAAERRIPFAMAAGTVAEIAWQSSFQPAQAPPDAAARNLTLLLDVAPLSLRRQTLRAGDRLMLLTLTSAVLERIPAARVRLVAFSLDQQREIFRSDRLAAGDLQALERALEGIELATVDYRVLQNRNGYKDLLARLTEQELSASPAADTVLFLGPPVRYDAKVAAVLPPHGAPRFFYLQYRPVFRRQIPVLPDTINHLVARMKGKSFVIRTPADFERAIGKIDR